MNHTEQLGDLLVGIYKNLKTKVERDLKKYDIGMGQLQLLMVFFGEIDNSFTQNELVKILSVDKGNISRSLVKLSSKGYIEHGNVNKKEYKISEVGKQLKSEIMLVFVTISAQMTLELESTEVSRTLTTLSKISMNLEEII